MYYHIHGTFCGGDLNLEVWSVHIHRCNHKRQSHAALVYGTRLDATQNLGLVVVRGSYFALTHMSFKSMHFSFSSLQVQY